MSCAGDRTVSVTDKAHALAVGHTLTQNLLTGSRRHSLSIYITHGVEEESDNLILLGSDELLDLLNLLVCFLRQLRRVLAFASDVLRKP